MKEEKIKCGIYWEYNTEGNIYIKKKKYTHTNIYNAEIEREKNE